jgi:hypothetical protein
MLHACCLVKTRVCPSQMNAANPGLASRCTYFIGFPNVVVSHYAGDRPCGLDPIHETADFCSMK